ncbi:MAG: S-methyl-5'-thioinosine phosphorylase [Pseudomonadota bacterium]|nr:S-methyl-5'-thioinosine phosphorylase [Pseudomonadota bacterium]
MTARIAIIGGTGLTSLASFALERHEPRATPWGLPSAPVQRGRFGDHPVLFLPRHGQRHTLAPQQVNYRANLWALRAAGAQVVLAVAAVGGIHPALGPGRVAVPDQLIDYTSGRAHSYARAGDFTHVDFTEPYDPHWRGRLLAAATAADVAVLAQGTYGVTNGPRLETAAEVRRLQRDGCDMIGMTAMPEAALARELGLPYAAVAASVNWAAGMGPAGQDIHAEIAASLETSLAAVRRILLAALAAA